MIPVADPGRNRFTRMEQKVLLVDDDPVARAFHADILAGHFRLATASSAAEALRRLRQDGPFAVVVSALFLPTPDGRSFPATVRLLCPDAALIVLAADPSPETVMNALNNDNVFGFFNKSEPMTTIIRKVRAALDLHRRQAGMGLPADRNILSMEERSFLRKLAISWPC